MRLPQTEMATRPHPLFERAAPQPWLGLDTRILRQGLELLMAILVGSAVGVAIAAGYASAVFAALGALTFLRVGMYRPEYAILTLIGLNSGIVDTEWLPWLTLGPVTFHISDLLLFFMLGLIFLRGSTQTGFKLHRSPLATPILLFIGALILSMINAVAFQGVGPNNVLRMARFIFYWLTFFAVTQLVRDEASLRRLLNGIWILAAILLFGALMPNVLAPLHLLPVRTSSIGELSPEIAQTGGLRIYTYGDRIFHVIIPVIVALLALDKRRRTWAVFMLVALIFWLFNSFQRNYLLTTLLNLGLILLLVPSHGSLRFFKRLAPALLLAMLGGIIVLMAQPHHIQAEFEAWDARLESMIGTSGQIDPNLEYRLVENHYAYEQIEAHSVFGIGLRNAYRPRLMYETSTTTLNWYMHNAYLWVWVTMGVVGLIPFLWLCTAYLIRTFRHYREIENDELRAIYLGFGVAFVGTVISNLVAPNLVQHWSLIIYPTMMGINEVIYRLSKEGQIAQ